MDLLIPEVGLVVFQTIAFLLLLFILSKFAWKPVLAAIKERENSIDDALNKAELAKQEMARLTSQNEDLMKQARAERDENRRSTARRDRSRPLRASGSAADR